MLVGATRLSCGCLKFSYLKTNTDLHICLKLCFFFFCTSYVTAVTLVLCANTCVALVSVSIKLCSSLVYHVIGYL